MTAESASEALDALLWGEYDTSNYRAMAAALEALAEDAGRADEEEIRDRIDTLRSYADRDDEKARLLAEREEHPRSPKELLDALAEDMLHPMTTSEGRLWSDIPFNRREHALFLCQAHREVRNRQAGTWDHLPGGYGSLRGMNEYLHERMMGERDLCAQDTLKRFEAAKKEYHSFQRRVNAEVERRLKEAQP